MNLTMNAAPGVTRTPAGPDAVATQDGAAPSGLPSLLLPFPRVIAAGAALLEAAATPHDLAGAPPALGTDSETDSETDYETSADAAPDALLAAMALPITAAALPAMMLAMPAPKTAGAATPPATDTAPDATPGVTSGLTPGLTPSTAPVTAPALRALPESAPVGAAPLPARADSGSPKATIAVDAAPLDTAAADAAPEQAATGIAAGAAQPGAARAADKLQLAGPPAAWRQTLHEALGERLQLQLGRGSEQATIRLEPPMLGRIDIAIRHSGGNLEVHIAASNVDVLRQLNTVSDSLRGDLAGRQYASVSVNVSEIPRTQASAQAGGQPMSGQPDAQGRRSGGEQQQQQEQQRTPGLALNDAGAAGSLFSLNGRDYGRE